MSTFAAEWFKMDDACLEGARGVESVTGVGGKKIEVEAGGVAAVEGAKDGDAVAGGLAGFERAKGDVDGVPHDRPEVA